MKTARFFCESCGRAVPFNAEMCPNCGKTFDAVKCPVCSHTGMPGEFLRGCPRCGYLSRQDKDDHSILGDKNAHQKTSPFSLTYTLILALLFGILVLMLIILLR